MLSYPSRGANHLKTVGLLYAKKTKEDACNPKVFENRSIEMPRKNETTITVLYCSGTVIERIHLIMEGFEWLTNYFLLNNEPIKSLHFEFVSVETNVHRRSIWTPF